jgi:arsenate reductase (thioredoxin)
MRAEAGGQRESAARTRLTEREAFLVTETRRRNVLFLCTHNSARSIMAEALLRSTAGERFDAWSAGSHPAGRPNPLALATLERLAIPTQGLRSKSWDEFARRGAPAMDFVFTVCDNAAGEICPVWPGQPVTAHWGVEDPSQHRGTEAERAREFARVAGILKRRIDLFASLPHETLDRLAIAARVRDIGRA